MLRQTRVSVPFRDFTRLPGVQSEIGGNYEATLAEPQEGLVAQTTGDGDAAPGQLIKVGGGHNTLKLKAKERVTINENPSMSTVVDTGAGVSCVSEAFVEKAGAKCMCVDLRAVNAKTKGDAYPMPNAEELIDEVGDATIMSTLDMLSGYYQIRMDPADKDMTAFVTKDGLFCFDRVPFGLKNAGATFQCVMNEVLEGLPYSGFYVDDILI